MENYALIKYAEIESFPKLKEREQWTGIYKGVRFEISKHKNYDKKDCWCHYIILAIDSQMSPENADQFWLKPRYHKYSESGVEHTFYDYYESIIGKISFHGGCTWYSKESNEDEKRRQVKIGCDYNHLWDEGKCYNVDYVYEQVKETIDSLIRLIGPLKIRSFGDGQWRLLEDFQDAPLSEEQKEGV